MCPKDTDAPNSNKSQQLLFGNPREITPEWKKC